MFSDPLMQEIRDRFHHVDHCPYQGKRIFFENAGGALTLKSVTETSALLAAIPDNHGRDNPASCAMMEIIAQARVDIKTFMGASSGVAFVGETGTELLFRLVRTAATGTHAAGKVVGSTLEHPSSSSASAHWSNKANKTFIRIPHNSETGTVAVEDYRQYVTADTCVATIVHTNPITGMSVDIKAIAECIRKLSPDCFIIVDGIQHAAHGGLDIDSYPIDGYVISPYKVFSRHGYGVAWVSDRLCQLPHEQLNGTPDQQWELGTRDTASFATFTNVVDYFDWLGSQFTNAVDQRSRIQTASKEIKKHEKGLVDILLHGNKEQRGIAQMPGVNIIGGVDNDAREGLVSLTVNNMKCTSVVGQLAADGIRTHIRKSDHYSGDILRPLNLASCVRVSMCHYNTEAEVLCFLQSMEKITANSQAS